MESLQAGELLRATQKTKLLATPGKTKGIQEGNGIIV